jgi:hypothetical protein
LFTLLLLAPPEQPTYNFASSPQIMHLLEFGMAALKVGELAPDFELQAVTGDMPHKFRLSDCRGKKNVVLAFYPADWTPT